MKKVIMTMMGFAFALCLQAQDVKKNVLDLRFGVTYPLASTEESSQLGPQFALEWRHNLCQSRFEVGAELYWGSALRSSDSSIDNLRAETFAVSALGYYRFYEAPKMHAFCGFGFGYARLTSACGEPGFFQDYVIASPRVGVQMFKHLRLTADFRLSKKRYNTCGLTIGYVF